MRVTRLFAVTITALALAGSSASAGWLNEVGRRTGLGWSDGYHAYEGCPDSRHRSQPWQRRAERGGQPEEPLVPYLEPTPAPAPRPAPEPTPQPQPKMSRVKTPASPSATVPPRTSQLHISRPNY